MKIKIEKKISIELLTIIDERIKIVWKVLKHDAHLNGSDPWADVLLSRLEAKLVLVESPWFATVVRCSVL